MVGGSTGSSVKISLLLPPFPERSEGVFCVRQWEHLARSTCSAQLEVTVLLLSRFCLGQGLVHGAHGGGHLRCPKGKTGPGAALAGG